MREDPLVVLAARNYREQIVRARWIAELLCTLPLSSLLAAHQAARPRLELAAKSLSLEALLEVQRDSRIVAALHDARERLVKELELETPRAPSSV